MSKRAHTTDVGSIACTDLSELGAGKEGWLVDDPNLACALDTHSIALANKFQIFIINWADPDDAGLRAKIRPELSPIEAEVITAVEWLVFEEIRVVAIGTSKGYLLVYDLKGDLLHRQLIYPGRVLKIRVRGTKRDLTQDTSSEEVCIVIPGVIARFDGSDIQNMLWQRHQDTGSQFWDRKPKQTEDMGNSYERLPYQLWNVNKYGSTVDAAITGVMPPPLMELQFCMNTMVLVVCPLSNGSFLNLIWFLNSAAFIVGQSSQRYYRAITIGEDAVISAFRLSEDKSRSLVGAILSKVVPAAFSTIASFSKMIWRSEQPQTKPEPKPQPFARASPLTCVKDYPRKGEKLTLSPSGTLAAITDSLGRILLLDTQALVVVRLWKGYRDANCLFTEMLVKRDTAASSSACYETVKSDYCLCLAIHAPRKGIIEVWQMRTGPRLLTIQCARGSRIVQPTYRFGSLTESYPYVPLEVFLLNGDSGQLSLLNRSLS